MRRAIASLEKARFILFRLIRRFKLRGSGDALAYWRERAKEYGARAVLNVNHPASEFVPVTQRQKDILYPFLRAHLRGDERIVADFGCGPGRFTSDLAKIIGGVAIGIDPIEEFLELAPKGPDVMYKVGDGVHIPMDSASIDLVWVCLVFGGMSAHALRCAAIEIQRVLRPNGLLFLVENTSETPDCDHWIFRSVEEYRSAFHEIRLQRIGDYEDVGERITIMTGRKV